VDRRLIGRPEPFVVVTTLGILGDPQVALEVSVRAPGVRYVVSHSLWAGFDGSFAAK